MKSFFVEKCVFVFFFIICYDIKKGCDGMLLSDKLMNKVDFSKSEIVIADFIIQLEKNKNYSARSIAKETYTSPATVLNLCKKTGIEGFDNFKKAYLSEIEYLNQQFGAVDPNLPFDQGDTIFKIANKMGSLYEETIKDTLSLLHHDLFQKLFNY